MIELQQYILTKIGVHAHGQTLVVIKRMSEREERVHEIYSEF